MFLVRDMEYGDHQINFKVKEQSSCRWQWNRIYRSKEEEITSLGLSHDHAFRVAEFVCYPN